MQITTNMVREQISFPSCLVANEGYHDDIVTNFSILWYFGLLRALYLAPELESEVSNLWLEVQVVFSYKYFKTDLKKKSALSCCGILAE